MLAAMSRIAVIVSLFVTSVALPASAQDVSDLSLIHI